MDYNKLRNDLIDYLGTSINYYPMVIVEIEEVYRANDEGLIRLALRYGFNLDDYNNDKSYTRYKI